MIFYTLHEIFNTLGVDTDIDGNIDHGKRNCKLFMIGSFIYICLLVFLMNRNVYNPSMLNKNYQTGLLYIIITDCIVMSYIYKSYFGRFITHEMNETNEGFKYDDKTHKYSYDPNSLTKTHKNILFEKNKELIEESLKFLKNSETETPLYMEKGCSICLEDFKLDTDRLVSLNCGHIFHKKCKDKIKNKKCPICRFEL